MACRSKASEKGAQAAGAELDVLFTKTFEGLGFRGLGV